MSKIILMEFPDGVFNHRIVGVVIHDGYVLLQRNIHDDFWTLPGGKAEWMDTALRRLPSGVQHIVYNEVLT